MSQEIQQTIAEVAGVIRAKSAYGTRDYAKAKEQIDRLQIEDGLNIDQLEKFAKQGLLEHSVVALATLGQLPVEMVERSILQERSELLIFIARAIGLPWSTTKAILLLRRGTHALSESMLTQSLSNFEHLKPSTARQAVRFYLLRDLAKPSHQSKSKESQSVSHHVARR